MNGLDVFDYKWGNRVVTGDERAAKPNMINLINSAIILNKLKYHIDSGSTIAIHCDVDVDGVGSGYILGRFIMSIATNKVMYIINKDKEHGVMQKHADYFKGKGLGLLIVVDSSSNELDIIKQFDCDVIVIDHHEINHRELKGKTYDGHDYIICNNTLDNLGDTQLLEMLKSLNIEDISDIELDYHSDDRMSCGLVVYELMRLYQKLMIKREVLENLRLYQWAGVTLFTDAIALNTPRNQWYIENTVHSQEVESSLGIIVKQVNPYKFNLDKSLINYTIAPIINKAIRAGASGEALSVIMYNPHTIDNLFKYKQAQDDAIGIGIENVKEFNSFLLRDMSNTAVSRNYNGVIASRLCGEFNKNTVVYRVHNGIAEGSFRGRIQGVDYRQEFDAFNSESSGQGHKVAFGFRCLEGDLIDIMNGLTKIETETKGHLLTAGKLNSTEPGQFIIDDMEQFKRQGGIWRLGIGNSKLSTDEQIMITVSACDATLIETRGKLYIYDILGLHCKAFEPIKSSIINIYVEYSKQIDCYIK